MPAMKIALPQDSGSSPVTVAHPTVSTAPMPTHTA
jgi:hypothetical protein